MNNRLRSLNKLRAGFSGECQIQTRGMNPRRRDGENRKTVETKAAAAGAKKAFAVCLFKLC